MSRYIIEKRLIGSNKTLLVWTVWRRSHAALYSDYDFARVWITNLLSEQNAVRYVARLESEEMLEVQ